MAEVGLREYVERIIEERHALYLARFDAIDTHMQRALAALTEGKQEGASRASLLVSAGALLIALAALVLALWRH